jgi:hypothetical protein
MSFVPAPQQANAAGANNAPTPVSSAVAAPAAEPESDKDILFKLRTFDVYWVDKTALMYRDGFDKVSTRTCASICCVAWSSVGGVRAPMLCGMTLLTRNIVELVASSSFYGEFLPGNLR